MCVTAEGVAIGADPLELSLSNPAAPAANKVRLFGSRVGGRMMPAFIGPSGLSSSLQASFARNNVSFVRPQGNGTVLANMGLTLSPVGTVQAANVATNNLHTMMKRINYVTTAAATTNIAGFRSTSLQYMRGNAGTLGGFHFVCRFGPSTGNAANATRRCFVGLSSSIAPPTDVNPSTALPDAIGICCDSTDGSYQFISRTGTLAALKVNTAMPKSAVDNKEVYELAMFCPPGGTTVHMEFTDLTFGLSTTTTMTTSLPMPTSLLAPQGYYSVGGTSSTIGMALMSLYIETDF